MYFVFYLLGFISYINFEIRDSHQKQASSLSSLPAAIIFIGFVFAERIYWLFGLCERSKNDKIGYSYSILYEFE